MQRILDFYERCQAAQYGFSPEQFSNLLHDIAETALGKHASEHHQAKWVSTLHLDDLVLAHACARGHEAGWERFISLFREKLFAVSLTIARDESLARELVDSVYADLFGTRTRSDGRRKSKLESYSGRGSLEGWLRTVLAQAFVDRVRRERKLVPFAEIAEPYARQEATQECGACDSRVVECTDAELAALCPEDKVLLAAHYLDGRTLAEIGRMLSLHESTVARRLQKITTRLRKRIVARLCTAGIPKRTAEEMLEVDVRDLAIDVRKRLAQEGQG